MKRSSLGKSEQAAMLPMNAVPARTTISNTTVSRQHGRPALISPSGRRPVIALGAVQRIPGVPAASNADALVDVE